MRAVQFDAYGAPGVLHLRDAEQPHPGPGEVLVDVYAASLNPVDWKVRAGLVAANFPLAFPATTGRDGAGIVRGVGHGVDPALMDKRIAFFAPRGQGTWTEQIALPAAGVAIVPDEVTLVDAAAMPLAGTSAFIPLVDIAEVSDRMRVLIHAGAGGVGTFAIQIARARGADVFATCSQRNADFVTALGAKAITYDQAPFETQVRDIDVVLDVMGGDVHERSYQVLKRGGLMVCLNAEPFTDCSAEYGVSVKIAPIFPKREILEALLQMMKAGRLRPAVEKTMPITDFRQAHEMSETGHVRGKVVMIIRNDDGTPVA
jgi:NADPH:quinone reductase-like Zn-dependent oxidoreductase